MTDARSTHRSTQPLALLTLAAALFAALSLAACASKQATAAAPAADTSANATAPAASKAPADPSTRFAKDIQKFKEMDQQSPPKPGGVVFTGSSSIRLWDIQKWFPDLGVPAVNRGFGGSQTSDVNRHFDTVVTAHQPRVIVFYCGGNDIAAGKSPETVIADFKTFMTNVRTKAPNATVIYMSNNPSERRWNERDKQQAVNAAVKQMADGRKLIFVNTYDALLNASGEPEPKFYRPDKLHLSEDGYAVVTERIKPVVKQALSR